MSTGKIYAVLTGDLIGYSRFKPKDREVVISILKAVFRKLPPGMIASKFHIFRGDSFQGVLSMPDEALLAALIIRSGLISGFSGKNHRLDARIAIGLGTIDRLGRRAGEGDGEAFRNSGTGLDGMKKGEQNMTALTPWKELNEELRTECALLDALIMRWSREQAEAIMHHIMGKTQEEIAGSLKISQPAVFQRLKTGGMRAVQEFLRRYRETVKYNAGNL